MKHHYQKHKKLISRVLMLSIVMVATISFIKTIDGQSTTLLLLSSIATLFKEIND